MIFSIKPFDGVQLKFPVFIFLPEHPTNSRPAHLNFRAHFSKNYLRRYLMRVVADVIVACIRHTDFIIVLLGEQGKGVFENLMDDFLHSSEFHTLGRLRAHLSWLSNRKYLSRSLRR